MFDFAKITSGMTAAEILNYYRNLYYAEPQVTERGIVANAINDYFADVVQKSEVIPCKIGDTVWGITKYSGGLTRKARKSTVSAMFFLDDMRLCIVARSISRGEWGKEIFATQEEAEAAIERCGQ